MRNQIEENISLAKQVHGNKLLWISSPEFKQRDGDAIGTSQNDLIVAVQTADCTPVLLAAQDSSRQAIAIVAIHAGWRGTAAKIVESVINELPNQIPTWNRVKSITATIGPCISKSAFEVESDVVNAFPELKAEPKGKVNGREKFLFDLEGENARQLQLAVERLNLPLALDRMHECTLSQPEIYPSYRRDGSTGERIISFIGFSK